MDPRTRRLLFNRNFEHHVSAIFMLEIVENRFSVLISELRCINTRFFLVRQNWGDLEHFECGKENEAGGKRTRLAPEDFRLKNGFRKPA